MKRKIISFALVGAIIIISYSLISWNYGIRDIMNNTGAPAGHTGSPGDGKNCTACHTGSTGELQSGWITSNVPVTGYVPGDTYTITASATKSGTSKFGFQVSPQDNSGNLLGTLTSTSAETQITGSSKYITHTASGTTGSGDSKTWSFSWKAPAKGTGNVTFYGAFNCTNADNSFDGDVVYTSKLVISENTSVGIFDETADNFKFRVFPNPATDEINLNYFLPQTSLVEIKVYEIDGKVSKVLLSEPKVKGEYTNRYSLEKEKFSKGIYFVELRIGDKRTTQKILIE